MRRIFSNRRLACMLLAALAGLADVAAGQRAPGNVLVIVLDDVAAEDVVPLPLPSLDRLAARGVTFTRAHANGICSPTRRSLMTGMWWWGSAANACGPSAADDAPLDVRFLPRLAPALPSLLSGKWHLGGDPGGGPWERAPQARGFTSWRAGTPSNVSACGGSGYDFWLRVEDGAAAISTAYEPVATADALVEWWHATRGPRFAVWAPQLAHAPFHEPPASLLPAGFQGPFPDASSRYAAMIVALDTLMGHIVDRVVDLDRDLVIVLGDNGTPPTVTPDPWRGRSKGTVFTRGTHVPLVVAGLGRKSPAVCDSLVHAADVFATVAHFVGADPGAIDGRSLLRAPGHDFVVVSGDEDVGIRTRTALLRRTAAGDELYDTDSDPDELVNRADDPTFAGLAAALRAQLDGFLAR